MNKLLLTSSLALVSAATTFAASQPNIIIILVDDMGYSDLGCFGGEITTPNINQLAEQGVRCTQFYTASRSCPTRASLMTGLYQHSAGIGYMSEDPIIRGDSDIHDWDIYEYRGALNRDCITLGELLHDDYNTYMIGKWHLGMHGQQKWPLQRGFDRFYGILSGASSYLRPEGERGLTIDNKRLPAPDAPYYTTDAFTDYAIDFIKTGDEKKPFFLYLAYNAPHWPLQAKESDIALFEELYLREGWDNIRDGRLERMKELGILTEECGFAEWENRSWSELSPEEQKMSAYRMAVYAAQIHSVDDNVGRLLSYLEEIGERDNTLIFFMSDNGACAEPMVSELGGGEQEKINDPSVYGHPSYGRAWAQVSNTPFRKYKQRAYEGGISSPLIVNWSGLKAPENSWCSVPAFLPDIMATIMDASGVKYPKSYHGNHNLHQPVGSSLFPALSGKTDMLHEYIYWEHQGNRAVRRGDWKGIWDQVGKRWELYDIGSDRIETKDLSKEHPEIIKELSSKWKEWADEHNVIYPFKKLKTY